jgi:RNA polymerase sigma-70 factor (ECF subfamily)
VKSANTVLKEWVVAAKAGDEAGWTGIYTQIYPGMYATALGICQDMDVAADLVQEAFVAAYLKLPQLTHPERFGGWLKQIVVHKCYQAISKKGLIISLDHMPPDWGEGYESELDKAREKLEHQHRLHGLLAALPDVLSGPLLLRYFSSFQSYEEIASILQIPIGTVRSRLNQAKKKIKAYWQDHTVNGSDVEKEGEVWNNRYADWYGGMHAHNACKSAFVRHVQEAQVTFPTGRRHAGRPVFEQMIAADREVGSSLQPFNILSSGNLSIIESRHSNSPDHPHHCPDRSVVVLFRKGGQAAQLIIHTAQK